MNRDVSMFKRLLWNTGIGEGPLVLDKVFIVVSLARLFFEISVYFIATAVIYICRTTTANQTTRLGHCGIEVKDEQAHFLL